MLHALVGGKAVRGAAHPLVADYGPLTAGQCRAVITGSGAPNADGHIVASCGATEELIVEVGLPASYLHAEL